MRNLHLLDVKGKVRQHTRDVVVKNIPKKHVSMQIVITRDILKRDANSINVVIRNTPKSHMSVRSRECMALRLQNIKGCLNNNSSVVHFATTRLKSARASYRMLTTFMAQSKYVEFFIITAILALGSSMT